MHAFKHKKTKRLSVHPDSIGVRSANEMVLVCAAFSPDVIVAGWRGQVGHYFSARIATIYRVFGDAEGGWGVDKVFSGRIRGGKFFGA
jgi:hypothetical protein